jgi:SpoVK/Ycf46/Vps4 family AAA+-type ATPase
MKQTNKTLTILSPQQEEVLRQILPIAKIATSGTVANLPVRPRTHTLIAGPSGAGKSHIAREIGRQLGIPTMVINVSSWVVLSARNEPWTYSEICSWLDANGSAGGILVLDEIDKLTSEGDSSWLGHIILEIHDLLDSVIPLAVRLPNQPETDAWECAPSSIPDDQVRTMLSARLRNKVFILGCGAWQCAWVGMAKRKIGFGRDVPDTGLPGARQILEMMKPELRQRFRNAICWLPPMTGEDYHTVSARIEAELPEPCMRETWNRLATPMIRQAMDGGLGMRVFEELMLSVLLESPGHPAHSVQKRPSCPPLI